MEITKDAYQDEQSPDLVARNETLPESPDEILTTTSPPKQELGRKCRGECVSGFFNLLCENVDEDASCPGDASCCFSDSTTEVATRRPHTTPRPTTPTSECPGICLPYTMGGFCNGQELENTKCHSQSFCCIMRNTTTTSIATTPTATPRSTPATDNKPVDFFMDLENVISSNRPNVISDCPGICMKSSLIDFCASYINGSDLCIAGRICCTITHKKIKLTNLSEHNRVTIHQTKIDSEQTTVKLPLHERRCQGRCVFGLSIMFCLDLDTNAACPSYGMCCRSGNELETNNY